MHARRGRRGAAVALINLFALTAASAAWADGTETLGPPSVPVAEASNIAIGGAGMFNQPATMTVDVPGGATVAQVFLYWEALHGSGTAGDDTIVIDGIEITGAEIGGSDTFCCGFDSTTFRADITDLGLVAPGANSFEMSGMDNPAPAENDGAGIVVLYDDGSANTVELRDGNDVAFRDFPPPRNATAPQVFTFTPSLEDRTADLHLLVGGVNEGRPNEITITPDVGPQQVYVDRLFSEDGDLMDAVTVDAFVPAGASQLSVTVDSFDEDGGGFPASLVWLFAGLVTPPPADEPCPDVDTSSATASGRAYGISARLLGLNLVNPPFPDTNVQNPATALTVPLGSSSVSLLNVVNDRDVTADLATDVATATTANVTIAIPGVTTVRAEGIVARSTSTADGFGARSTPSGSTIARLQVGTTVLTNVTEPVNIPIRIFVPLVGDVVVGEVQIFAKTPTGAAAGVPQPEGDTFRSGLTVEAIRVVVRDVASLPGNQSTDVRVASASSRASFPSLLDCRGANPYVAGEAALLELDNVNPAILGTTLGLVQLPSTGGFIQENVADTSPVGAVTGRTQTLGTLDPLQAASFAQYENLNLLNLGALRATAVTANVSSTNGVGSGNATLASLALGGTDLCAVLGLPALCTPPPNTVINLPAVGTLVVLNEHVPSTGGLQVNAVHIYVLGAGNPLGLPVGAEVLLSRAYAASFPV